MSRHQRWIDAAKYAPLAAAYTSAEARQGTSISPADVGAYRTKAVHAGEHLYISCYPLIGCNANQTQRKRLEELSISREQNAKLRAKYARFNNKRRIAEFEQLVHANMIKGDLHVCCTYEMQDYEHYASINFTTREDARNHIRNFLRRIKHLLVKHGYSLNEFRWICCTVTKRRMDDAIRPWPDTHHHHLLMHGVPEYLRTQVERLWPFGYCNADRLQDSDKGFADMAGYIARQESSANGERHGERSYTTSRNIIRPRVTTSDSKISRRRVALIAADVLCNGREIFETLFPGFRLVEEAKIHISTFVAGAYIYAKLRRKPAPENQIRTRLRI